MTPKRPTHLVVDGSNIATEGRSIPSLVQLDEAVRAILEEFPHERLTVVVDATFGHRIADSERDDYEEAILAGEIVAPPAGAVGRGDAFILQVAEKAGATVFSNDSFQEFHGEHEWLFDEGRLIGGKPVPGVGWVFVSRVPVRGPASRRATRQSKRGGKRTAPSASPKEKVDTKAEARAKAKAIEAETMARRSAAAAQPASVGASKANASSTKRQRRSRGAEVTETAPAIDIGEALNDPPVFLNFIAEHRIGSVLEATVDHFSSHGAYVVAAGARCYLPTKTMGDPPPNRARDLIDRGDIVRVEVQSLDAQRRGINVGFVDVVHKRREVEATAEELDRSPVPPGPLRSADEAEDTAHLRSDIDVATRKRAAKKAAKKAPSGRTVKRAGAKKAAATKAPAEATPSPRARKAAARKAPAKKAAAKKAPAKKAAAKKAPAKKATAKKAAAKKTIADRAPAKRATAKKAAARKAVAKKAPTKKATAKKATAKKAGAKKAARSSRPAR
jgi:hypothetical protein